MAAFKEPFKTIFEKIVSWIIDHFLLLLTGVIVTLAGSIWAWLQGLPAVVVAFIALATIAFLSVLFLVATEVMEKWGWLHKLKAWTSAVDKNAPAVILVYERDRFVDKKWKLIVQTADAFNVTSEPIRAGRFHARIKHLDRVAIGNLPVDVVFGFHDENGNQFASGYDLEQLFRSASLEFKIGYPKVDSIIPVIIHYSDALGKDFVSECEVDFSKDEPRITHKGVRMG